MKHNNMTCSDDNERQTTTSSSDGRNELPSNADWLRETAGRAHSNTDAWNDVVSTSATTLSVHEVEERREALSIASSKPLYVIICSK